MGKSLEMSFPASSRPPVTLLGWQRDNTPREYAAVKGGTRDERYRFHSRFECFSSDFKFAFFFFSLAQEIHPLDSLLALHRVWSFFWAVIMSPTSPPQQLEDPPGLHGSVPSRFDWRKERGDTKYLISAR